MTMDDEDDGLVPLDNREILEVLGIVFLAGVVVGVIACAGWAFRELVRAFA